MTSKQQFYRHKRVLVVDDSDQIRSYLRSMLQLIGFDDITLARDADVALSHCRKSRFDFILCDYQLGHGRDGYQLFELLRAEQLISAGGCFLVISAERQRHAVYGMIEFQPDDYLLKPFSYAELERRIARAFHIKQVLKPAYAAIMAQDYAAALLACDDAIVHKPKYSWHVIRLKAELLIRTGDYIQAEQWYQTALAERDFAWARLGLAVCYGYQDRYAEAQALLQELGQQHETRIEALDWLGRLHMRLGEIPSALDAIRVVAKTSPKNYLRQHVLANLAMMADDRDTAVQVHHRLLSAARYSMYDTADNMLNYARALLEQAKSLQGPALQDALTRMDSFVATIKKRFHPSSYEHDRLVLEARALMLQGKRLKALSLLHLSESLLEDKTLSTAALLDRARAYFEAGNLSMCDKYMQAASATYAPHDLYGNTLALMIEHEQRKHQVLRDSIMQQHNAGMTAYGNGDMSLAIDYFRSALASMPTNLNIAMNLVAAIAQHSHYSKELKTLAEQCFDLFEHSSLSEEQQRRLQQIYQQWPHF